MISPEGKAVILLCLAFSVAGKTAELGYDHNSAYVYNYEGYVVVGVPGFVHRFTGFQLKTNVHIERDENNTFVMQFADPNYRQVGDGGGSGDPIAGGPATPLSDVYGWSFKKASSVKAVLKLPVRFTWRPDGIVDGLQNTIGDEFWSLNLKKGFLTVLSTTFDKIHLNQTSGRFTQKREPSIEGQCKSDYFYLTKMNGSDIYVTLTRQRNLASCVSVATNNFSTFRPGSGPKINVDAQSEGESVIVVDENMNLVLRNATIVTRYSLDMTDKNVQSPAYVSRQELGFEKKINKSMTGVQTKWQAHKRGLQMYLPSTMTSRRRNYNRNLRQILNRHFRNLAFQPRYSGVSKARQLLESVSMMRRLSSSDLYNSFRYLRRRKMYRMYYLQTLGATGTWQAGKAIKQLIEDNYLGADEEPLLLHQGALSTIDPKYFLKLLQIMADDKSLRKETRIAVTLAAGSVINKLYILKSRKTEESASSFFALALNKTLKDLIANHKDIVILMALSNAGIPSLSDHVIKRFHHRYPRHIRVQAVESWNTFARRLPQRTWTLMVPLIMNQTNDVEIRIAAFLNLIASNPKSYRSAFVASQLRVETKTHVRNYVISYLKLIASRKRLDPKTASIAAFILRSLPQKLLHTSPLASGIFSVTEAGGKFMAIDVGVIYGPGSILPRSVRISVSEVVGGKLVKLHDMTFRSQNSLQLLLKMWNQKWKTKKTSRYRSTRSWGWRSRLKDKKRTSDDKDDFFDEFLSKRMFGDYYSVKSQSMKQFMTWWASFFKDKRQWQKEMGFENSAILDVSFHRPSTFGVQLAINRSLVYTGSAYVSTRRFKTLKGVRLHATGTALSRISLSIDSGLSEIASMRDIYAVLVPWEKRHVDILFLNQSISILPPQPKFSLPFNLLEIHTEVFGNENGFSSYKPNRRPRKPSLLSSKAQIRTVKYFRGAITKTDTFWPDVQRRSRSPWIPSSIKFNAPFLPKTSLNFYFNVTTKTAANKSSPRKAPKVKGKSIHRFYLRYVKIPQEASIRRDMWILPALSGEVKVRVTESNFRETYDNDDIRFYYERDFALIHAKMSRRNASISAFLSREGTKFNLKGEWHRSGPNFIYNSQDPFSIAVGAKLSANVTLNVSNQVVGSSRLVLSVSPEWKQSWKELLRFSRYSYRLPFTVRQCITDMRSIRSFGPPRFIDSPSCFKLWQRLNSWTKLSLYLENSLKQLSAPMTYLTRHFFSSVSEEQDRNSSEISAKLHPLDNHLLSLRQGFDQFSFDGQCEVSAYNRTNRWNDKFPEEIRIQSFVGKEFATTLSANESILPITLIQGKKPLNFSVTLEVKIAEKSRYGYYRKWTPDIRNVMVSFNSGNSSCGLLVKLNHFYQVSGGKDCKAAFDKSFDYDRVHKGLKFHVKPLNLTVVTSADYQKRIVRLWLSPVLFNKVDGACGEFGDPDYASHACPQLPCPPTRRLNPLN